jgi:hypothetical protein
VTADDANVTPFKVKERTGSEWWYKAKAVKLHEDKPKVDELKGVPIKVGDVVTLAPGAFALLTQRQHRHRMHPMMHPMRQRKMMSMWWAAVP